MTPDVTTIISGGVLLCVFVLVTWFLRRRRG